jgi:hypothetical protein
MIEYVKYIEKAAYNTCRLNILDLVIFDKLTNIPLKWIYTNKNAVLQVQYLRDISFDKVIKNFIQRVTNDRVVILGVKVV